MKKILFLILLAGFITACGVNPQKNESATLGAGKIDIVKINKMVYLHENLSWGLSSMHNYAYNLFNKLKEIIDQKGNSIEGVDILKKATNLVCTSDKVLNNIHIIHFKVYSMAGGGGFNKIGKQQVEKPAKVKEVFEMMIGNNKEGKGYQIQKELDEYVAYLNENFGGADQETYNSPRLKNFETLTEDYKNDYVAQKKSTTTDTDFARYHFANVPVIEVLMTLTSKQIEIIKYEIKCLEKMNTLAAHLP
jgi:hypothetical protein